MGSSQHAAFKLVDAITTIDERISALTYASAFGGHRDLPSQPVLHHSPHPTPSPGDIVFVGTATGRLFSYRVTSSTSAAGRTEYTSTRLCAVEVSAAKQPVTHLEAVPDLGVLVTLCDGAVGLWDANPLRRRPAGGLDAKFAVGLALDVHGPPAHKLAVLSGKKTLRLYEWSGGKYLFSKELSLPAVPKALVYIGTSLLCGYTREYNVLDEVTGAVRDITGIGGRDTHPLVKHLPGDNVLITTAEELGVVVTPSGDPAVVVGVGGESRGVPAVQFGHRPTAVAYW